MKTDKLLAFKTFCLESYKAVHGLTGKVALDVFREHRVFDYITSCYDVLHSNGKLFIVNDIDDYISHRASSYPCGFQPQPLVLFVSMGVF